jgi:hypothetical protein
MHVPLTLADFLYRAEMVEPYRANRAKQVH